MYGFVRADFCTCLHVLHSQAMGASGLESGMHAPVDEDDEDADEEDEDEEDEEDGT